ncbi:phospholipid-transporting ATPase ABCA3-like [Papilio machaon]|uniref:phospholipid-transporting ATPase ABCA3-like n=1 Tax=Papilio machaon TaxID=76193 RepID=UPI001E6630E4|nr:phospholipid-transporting ATPase ABCA3-like [Papilio machaon]
MGHYLLLHCSGTIIAAIVLDKDDTLDNVETMSLYAHLLKFAYESLEVNHGTLLLVDNLSMFIPMYIFVLSIKRLTNSARYNQMCLYYYQFCTQTQGPLDYPSDVCCGECFGLTGLNSSGKTTVFKVLTRYDLLTRGNIFANCYFINKQPDNYLHSLGYSHQTFGMDFFRSGEVNLRTLLAFRGLTAADIECENNTWLKVIGMDQSRSYIVSGLSGGMRQRLSTVTALSGGAPVLLMDEPTNGLDPAARRVVWEALEHNLCYGRSLVLASHNMEEVERLCNNFTILDEGEMSMLCTPTHFRVSYARGHTVLIKLRVNSVVTDTGFSRVEMLKEMLAAEFKSPLRDEHLTCLRYIVAARLHYSEVYCKVYELTQEFADIVEDFSVFDGTLEDGFIQFVQDSRFNVRQARTW